MLAELGSVLLELGLDRFLLSVGNLAVLVGVELLHELSLHLSLTSLELGLHLGLLLLGQLGALELLAAAGALTAVEAGALAAMLAELGSVLLEFSLGSSLLLVGELTVLVGVELLHELGLHLSLLGLELSLHLGLLLLGQLGTGAVGTTGTLLTEAGTLAAVLAELGSILLELGLGSSLLLVGELAVLVGVELLHELGLHLSLTSLELGLHFSLLLFSELGALTAVHLHAAGLLGSALGLLGAILSHDGHGGEQSNQQGFLHGDVCF